MNLFTVRYFLCDPVRRSDQSTVLQSSCAGFLSLDGLFSASLTVVMDLPHSCYGFCVSFDDLLQQQYATYKNIWCTCGLHLKAFGNQQHGTIGFRTLFYFRPITRDSLKYVAGYIVGGNNDVKVSCLLLISVQFDCISITLSTKRKLIRSL